MSVKAIATNTGKKSVQYPYLGISDNGRIVLFHAHRKGICVRAYFNVEKVGEYNEEWCESAFKPYEGTVTLSND